MGGDLVPCSGRYQYGITGLHILDFTVDLHLGLTLEYEVEFLANAMVVTLGGTAGGYGGLSQRLIFDRCVGEIQQAANGGTVFGGKRRLCGESAKDHGTNKNDGSS